MRGRIALAGVMLLAAGCSTEPERTDPPDGLTAEVMQYRGKRLTREIAVAVSNDTDRRIELTSMRLTSNRWSEPVRWSGSDEVGAGSGTGLDVDPPTGTCPGGEGLTASADLTYRFGDEERRSVLPVEDPYGVLRDLVDGDCGEQAFDEAVTMTVGAPQVRGGTWSSRITLTPRRPNDTVLLGFAPTLRFAFGPRTPAEVELPLDRPQRLTLDVVMGRCDPHIVAEDKVGSRFGAWVRTPGLEYGYFTLPLDDEIHQSLEQFYAQRCRP
ncbi:hypothetical protein GL325_11840 [Aeromicrobium sp. 636]|uniref:Lipoprotein n=1 Tax=Aeromicrobium senzhongii TaxID=2663859 RepID=A0A8I0K395_9ACTN|nr:MULTISPECIES: hypothetical protein [Aeromicrobium]MBC9227020.1 hypothetical protein [Aeromicrobium senzhongii]MCQ3999120.1 hypothetical protein [Aeromicrobium sp. 636]